MQKILDSPDANKIYLYSGNSLRVFLKYIQSFYNTAFNAAYFFVVLTMLSVILFLNYVHPSAADFIHSFPWPYRFGWYYFFYFIPFAGAYLLQYFFYKDSRFLKNKYFLTLVIAAPVFFSFRVNFNFHHSLLHLLWRGDEAIFWQLCSDWIIKAVVLITLVYFTWLVTAKPRQALYGTAKLINAKPYFILLIYMLPLIVWAAMQWDFLQMYPRAQVIAPLHIANKGLRYFIFECCYAFDFVSIEFFFRGFLIIAFMRICGPQCIVPAACFYCCIHCGKPVAEAISSFFGGILLGIISYHTKSIWGSLLVHIGIAAMMELAGFAANEFLK